MKISICIPQYERINLLLKSLKIIENQTYDDIEIVVSDDCSKDNTEEEIKKLQKSYRYPIILSVNEKNTGYDRNYRKCIELATGDYAFVIGNDDTLLKDDDIEYLVNFLCENNYPEIGYCNYVEDKNKSFVVERARSTKVHGPGIEIALDQYNGFSFVGGLIYKKSAFDKYNTDKHDGSIYSQMYLGLLMIASGCRLFTIQRALVLKDLLNEDGSFRWSYYRDGLPKRWKDYKKMDGGLPSVANVLMSAVEDATGKLDSKIAYRILKRIQSVTLPFWIVKYKQFGSLPAAVGLIQGVYPPGTQVWKRIEGYEKFKLLIGYYFITSTALITPVSLFNFLEPHLQKMVKKSR